MFVNVFVRGIMIVFESGVWMLILCVFWCKLIYGFVFVRLCVYSMVIVLIIIVFLVIIRFVILDFVDVDVIVELIVIVFVIVVVC